MSNLLKRTISAIILAPLFLYVCYIGGYAFKVMSAVIFLIMLYEWVSMTKKMPSRVLLWWVFGAIYIGVAFLAFNYLEYKRVPNAFGLDNPPGLLFLFILLVWINDVCGYFFGKGIGGAKLAPKISPNKTWSGAVGGVVGCVSLFFVMNYKLFFASDFNMTDQAFYFSLGLHILVPIVSQIGDLFESYIKRKAKVKDSGNILPGHGGFLDRFDGLLLVLFVYGIYTFILIYVAVLNKMPA